MPSAYLALEDGSVWEGVSFGAPLRRTGEAVFNTSLTGYQEILTDPSYCRQIVVMTAPQIGNTGVNGEDDESARVWVAGFVVRAASPIASSWRATGTLPAYLHAAGVPAITGIDTRAVVRHLRDRGAMRAAVVADGGSREDAVAAAASAPDINAMDLVGEVSCAAPYEWTEAANPAWYALDGATAAPGQPPLPEMTGGGHVVVLDCGVKRNTLRLLVSRGCRVTVVPARTPPGAILDLRPDGVLLSNGPGDPARLGDIVDHVRELVGRVPVFGICLGHQLLGMALGGQTYKLKFGHRGANQPVRGPDGRVAVSSHNHGYALTAETLPGFVDVTHVNLNDGCVEGLAVPELDTFSVQYHPEAAPGPHDAVELFDRFLVRVAAARAEAGIRLVGA